MRLTAASRPRFRIEIVAYCCSGTGFALLAGTGEDIAQDTGGYAEIGLKIK